MNRLPLYILLLLLILFPPLASPTPTIFPFPYSLLHDPTPSLPSPSLTLSSPNLNTLPIIFTPASNILLLHALFATTTLLQTLLPQPFLNFLNPPPPSPLKEYTLSREHPPLSSTTDLQKLHRKHPDKSLHPPLLLRYTTLLKAGPVGDGTGPTFLNSREYLNDIDMITTDDDYDYDTSVQTSKLASTQSVSITFESRKKSPPNQTRPISNSPPNPPQSLLSQLTPFLPRNVLGAYPRDAFPISLASSKHGVGYIAKRYGFVEGGVVGGARRRGGRVRGEDR